MQGRLIKAGSFESSESDHWADVGSAATVGWSPNLRAVRVQDTHGDALGAAGVGPLTSLMLQAKSYERHAAGAPGEAVANAVACWPDFCQHIRWSWQQCHALAIRKLARSPDSHHKRCISI